MNCKRAVVITTLLAALGAAPIAFSTSSALAAELPAGLVAKDGWYTRIVDAAFVERYAVLPKPEGVLIIDSRPTSRKYDPGHIPTAINIPDTQFDKMADQLPQDKNTLLIFYCEGVDCILSHSSAFKAEKLGYTNIKVYAEGYPDWIAKGHMGAVSVPFLKKRMDEGASITVIDSRPKARKYDLGHIPGAISLPDSEFNKRVDALPADKASELYFYCEGLACTLSSDSAAKAVKLGYTKVKVVPEGYPKWAKLYGAGPTSGEPVASKPVVQAGRDPATITVESFKNMLRDAPDSLFLVDVRSQKDFEKGTIKGAVNMPLDTLESRLSELPKDKTTVFFCSSGARSSDAYDLAKEKKVASPFYFLDATVKYAGDGNYTISND